MRDIGQRNHVLIISYEKADEDILLEEDFVDRLEEDGHVYSFSQKDVRVDVCENGDVENLQDIKGYVVFLNSLNVVDKNVFENGAGRLKRVAEGHLYVVNKRLTNVKADNYAGHDLWCLPAVNLN